MTISDSAVPRPAPTTIPKAADLERFRQGLRFIALRALGDADAADEAVQETLARAVIALGDGRLDDTSKVAAYVAGIARHVCSHILRDRKDTVTLDAASAARKPGADSGLETHYDPLEALISAAEMERLRVAFAALSAEDQRLLRFCFHDDLTPAEVAAALAEPADRVRKRKSRALERLRRAFLRDSAGHGDAVAGTDRQTATPRESKGVKGHG